MKWISHGLALATLAAWAFSDLPAGARAVQPDSYAPAASPKVVRPSLPWGRDLEQAQKQARAEQKLVLMSFVGSDWCGWCLRMKREVFAKSEFQGFAQTNLVLVEVDFPRDSRQSTAERETNAALARRFGVMSVPTLLLLDGSGQKMRSWGFEDGGARHYVAEIRKAAAGPEVVASAGSTTNNVKAATSPAKKKAPAKTVAKKPAKKSTAPRKPVVAAAPGSSTGR